MSTLEVSDEVAEKIQQEAAAQGLSIDDYLRRLLPITETEPLTPQERAQKWREWIRSHKTKAPPLSDEAVRRESIYASEDEML